MDMTLLEDLFCDWDDNEIDCYFFMGNYPSNYLNYFSDFRVLSMDGVVLNKKEPIENLINISDESLSMEKVDFYDYGLIGEYRIVNLLYTKSSLYSNASNNDYIYTFLKTYMESIQKLNNIHGYNRSNYRPNLTNLYKDTFLENAGSYKTIQCCDSR